MNILFYLLPTFCALIGILGVLITYFCLWHRLKKSKGQILQNLKNKLDPREEIDDLLDDKLEDFIADLRSQIPMGSMLFTEALSKTIKGIAKKEILKMIPDIKERLLDRFSKEVSLKNIELGILRSELYFIILYGALIGFVLGLLWIFLF